MIKKMMERGSLCISEDVFAIISSIVIHDMDEIASTVSGIKEDLVRVVNKKGNQRGIIIDYDEDKLTIDIRISIYFGSNLNETCVELQQKVKKEIEEMTGVEVYAVNVTVESIKYKEAVN